MTKIIPKIVPISREQFMSMQPFTRKNGNGFAGAFYSKSDMQNLWPLCRGVMSEDGKVMSAIVTTVSQRDPHVANLQLLHTFVEFRGLGLGRLLTLDALAQAHAAGVKYFRVSAEPEAVEFYRKCGFRFLGFQKSRCQLSMFRIDGPTPADAVYHLEDPVIKAACSSKRKGGIHEFHPEFGGQTRMPEVVGEGITETTRAGVTLVENHDVSANFTQPVEAQESPRYLTPVEAADFLDTVGKSLFGLSVALQELTKAAFHVAKELRGAAGRAPAQPPPVAAPAPAGVPAAPGGPPPTAPAGRVPRAQRPKLPRPDPVAFLDSERLGRLFDYRDRASREGTTPWAINIRGTNGSGKSWIVHNFLREHRGDSESVAPRWKIEKIYANDRDRENDRPQMYIIRPRSGREICVVGQYETQCGGCDAMSSQGALDRIYDIVERQVTQHQRHVLFEGLIVCSDFRRTCDLVSQKFPLEVVLLNTPLEKCIQNVNDRRAGKGKEALPDPANIVMKHAGNERSVARFAGAGVNVKLLSVEETQELIRSRFQ